MQAHQAQLSQHAQQLLISRTEALKSAVLKLADSIAAVIAAVRDKPDETAMGLSGARQRRALAAGSDNGVDVDLTLNVPAGQAGSAVQSNIEGPSFGPALQQSLSNAGMPAQPFAI